MSLMRRGRPPARMSGPAGEESVNSTKTWTSCFLLEDRESFAAYTAYLLAMLLLLPLFILVLHVALQRWRSATTTTTAAHMDALTYHMVLLELLGLAGACFYYYVCRGRKLQRVDDAVRLASFVGVGQSLFHVLACLDRFLAVVHPIRYMWMRQSAGIRLRNVSIGCAWLLCLPTFAINPIIIRFYTFPILFTSVFFSSGTLCAFFAVSRSGPKRESRTKRRALHTVAAITMTLVLRFLSSLVPCLLLDTLDHSLGEHCLIMMLPLCFSLPSSLVMPLLFLQRARKLSNCQHTSRSESS